MKIEKVSDTQIRCTLTPEDLERRHLKLSELAYGTDKARSLFREMMLFASDHFGFDTEDLPIMVEAVPTSSGSIILLITKVEYPNELDATFSDFSEDEESGDLSELEDADEDDGDSDSDSDSFSSGYGSNDYGIFGHRSSARDILDLYTSTDDKDSADNTGSTPPAGSTASFDETVVTEEDDSDNLLKNPLDIARMFVFPSLAVVTQLALALNGYYSGENSLYRDPLTSQYYLIVSKSQHTPVQFNKVCNILTEYGTQTDLSIGTISYFREHYKILLQDHALQTLASL